MVITGDDVDTVLSLKQRLHTEFQMKDLGPLRYFLGLEVAYSRRGYLVSQQKYLSDIFRRADITDLRTASTPIELHHRLSSSDGEPLPDPTRYRALVGALVYLTITRPDIAYVVRVLIQFVSAPRSTHYAALLRVLRYLRGTISRSLLFSATSSLELRAYCDVDWAGDASDRRSTTGFCIFFGDSLISWKSKKQSTVAFSTTEAEYGAMSSTAKEVLWL
ncbi:uncharacterized mitochondrial protein AtMg00810-like [Dioscorea cayenensis subsp. rotundata]|uniref:Uncharacterized mitochondrial protein AtMg00810-like n=1 Tax=Dioscorea cayennensis subsp. rotundata TaxID=55577 RepID=A0AB40D956_DIOCR|nr:uncharacterized mitochondrial protein AtMg00810-like [Dioscorea cayenensis subsp. rotundata]